jgi:hypothetical protein
MGNEPGNLRLKQLDRTLASFRAAVAVPRPQKGWIRVIREAMGVSAGEVGRILGTSRQLPLQFEKALVPRAGSMREDRPRAVARKRAPGAERTPALKGKAVKRIDAAVGVEAPAPSAATDENLGPYFCD